MLYLMSLRLYTRTSAFNMHSVYTTVTTINFIISITYIGMSHQLGYQYDNYISTTLSNTMYIEREI